ncbi:MAG: hypothetical protein WCY19_02130 [Candidatus Gastranaerophilaceae bacterium]
MILFKKLFFILILYFLCIIPCYAQQTVFNVPSADVTPQGHLFLQQEAQFRGWNPGAFFNGTTYTAVGVGHNTEIDATLFNVGAPATQNISLGVGFKSAIPIPGLKEKFPEREFKLTVGSDVLIGLEGNGVGNWTYAHLSGRVPKLNTRLTAGVSYGTRQVFGQETTAFIAAVEQPVTKKLSLIGDWFSGDEHWAGYLIVGASYALPKNTTIYAGYQIPNSPKVGTSGFVIEVAKIF